MIEPERQALILLAAHPETVELAIKKLRPETLGVIVSQEILEAVVTECSDLRDEVLRFHYRIVDSPMEIGDSFSRFKHLLPEPEGMGYGRKEVLLGATDATTPMRLGVAVAEHARLRGL